MPDELFRPGSQHPEEWRQDLNPDAMAGQNVGMSHDRPGTWARTAYDRKDVHDRLGAIPDDELKRVPILEEGTRLEQGATYIDLNGDRREFTAMGDMEVGPRNRYVRKDLVDYQTWNRLIGVDNPERTGDAAED